jgi:hypothetical protein
MRNTVLSGDDESFAGDINSMSGDTESFPAGSAFISGDITSFALGGGTSAASNGSMLPDADLGAGGG